MILVSVLVVVGKLVSLHGGKISVDSVEHQGTTIKIVFPKKNKTSQSISDEASSKFEALAPVLPAPNVPAKTTATIDDPNLRRILVVEDNDELRSYLVSSLSSIYNVQACANGKEALIIIKEYWPELVLSDIMMPEMRGDCSLLWEKKIIFWMDCRLVRTNISSNLSA